MVSFSLFFFQLCTTAFLTDVAQYVKFGDLTEFNVQHINGFSTPGITAPPSRSMRLQMPVLAISNDGFGAEEHDGEPRLSDKEEDALVRESTAGFANFVTSLFHRVIMLMENLPEEGQAGTRAGGVDEGTSSV